MSKKENLSLDRIAPTRKPFPGLVSIETVCQAGFNYWETSMPFPLSGEIINVYIGDQILNPNVNIIVGCKTINKEKKRLYEWHFGTFEGKPRGETNGEETIEFDKKLMNILKPENIVDGRSLERRIKAILNKK